MRLLRLLRSDFLARRKRIALFNDVLQASCVQAGLKRKVRLVVQDQADDMSVTMLDYEAFEFRARHDFFDASAVKVAYEAARVVAALSYHTHPGRTVHFDGALAMVIAERMDAEAALTISGRIKRRLNGLFTWLATVTASSRAL
jgi:hypothetical protein